MPADRNTALFALLLLAAALLAGACHWYDRSEDPHIAFRYGENIAQGSGWVYNKGERVPGSTSPLWTLACAAFSASGLDPVAAGKEFGIGFTFLAALLVFTMLAPEIGALPAATAALLIVVDVLNAGAVGLEFPLLVFLGMCATALYLRGRGLAAACALAFMLFTRADGILLAGVLFADSCLRRRRLPWREAILVSVVTLPWFVFSRAYFGSFLPHTLGAKSAQLESGFWFHSYLRNAVRMLSRTVGANPLHLLVLPLAGLGFLARGTARALLLSWCGLYALAYALLGVPGYGWYYLIPSYGVGILAAAGVSVLAKRDWGRGLAVAVLILILSASVLVYPMAPALRAAARAYIDRRLEASPQNHPAEFYYAKADEMLVAARRAVGLETLPVAFAAAVVLFGVLLCRRAADRGRTVWSAVFCALLLLPRLQDLASFARGVPSERTLAYTRIGEWLRHSLPPRSVVAMEEIGIVGYHSRLPILDLGGLVSPAISRDFAAGDRVSWLAREAPDYILFQDLWIFEEPVRELDYFREGYKEVRAWPRGDGLTVRLYKKVREPTRDVRTGPLCEVARWDFRRATDAALWRPFNPRETFPAGRSQEGYPRYATSGDDSSLSIERLSVDPSRVARMELRLKIIPRFLRRRAGVAYLEWGEEGKEGYAPERRASFATKANGCFMEYSIDLSGNYAWRRAGTVTSLRVIPTDIESEVEWASAALSGPGE